MTEYPAPTSLFMLLEWRLRQCDGAHNEDGPPKFQRDPVWAPCGDENQSGEWGSEMRSTG